MMWKKMGAAGAAFNHATGDDAMTYADTMQNWPVASRTIDTAAVELAGGREFTATIYRHGDGTPLDLVLSVGFSSDANGWRAQAGTIALSPEALPEIIRALQALHAKETR